jgi:hypothetical protein
MKREVGLREITHKNYSYHFKFKLKIKKGIIIPFHTPDPINHPNQKKS